LQPIVPVNLYREYKYTRLTLPTCGLHVSLRCSPRVESVNLVIIAREEKNFLRPYEILWQSPNAVFWHVTWFSSSRDNFAKNAFFGHFGEFQAGYRPNWLRCTKKKAFVTWQHAFLFTSIAFYDIFARVCAYIKILSVWPMS